MVYDVHDFAADVLERSRSIPVLVDFWAEWCGPCRILAPVLERLASGAEGEWELKKLNTEEFPDLASRYGVRSIPHVKLFVNGKPVDEFTGALPESAVAEWLRAALPDRHEGLILQAESLIASSKPEIAGRILEEILSSAPRHEKARVLLARLRVFSDPPAALKLIEDIDAASPVALEAEAVRTLSDLLRKAKDPSALPAGPAHSSYLRALEKLAAQDFEGALTGFISVIRDHRYYDDDGPRKACIAIFKYLGEEHPITGSYRRAFSTALY